MLVAPVSNSKSEARRTAQVGRSESIGELEPINSDSSVVFRRVSPGEGELAIQASYDKSARGRPPTSVPKPFDDDGFLRSRPTL
jgi:hypothetical protein